MNFALVGAFVLGLAAVLIAVALWLASGGASGRQFDLYLAIEDESVAGLNLNAPVKFNGVDVGQVRHIELDPVDPTRVRLIFAIERGAPITGDTVAMLKTQGLTGIAYVELSGGTAGAAPLRAIAPNPYPVIRTKPSLSARLENVLSTALVKLDRTSSNIDAVLSDDNRAALHAVLADMAAVTHAIAARRGALGAGIADAARTFDNTARASAQIGPVLGRIGEGADAVKKLGDEAATASAAAGRTVAEVGADVQRFGAETLPELQRLLGEMQSLSVSLRQLSAKTQRDPRSLIFGGSPVPPGPGETGAPR